MKTLSKEVAVAAGALVLVVSVIVGVMAGYYRVESKFSDLSVGNIRLNSVYEIPHSHSIGMNVSFNVKNNMPYTINLNHLTYMLSVNNDRVGTAKADSLSLPPHSSKNVNINVKISGADALKAVNESLAKKSMELGVGVNYVTDVKLLNTLTFTRITRNIHAVNEVDVSRFVKQGNGSLLESRKLPHPIKVIKTVWESGGEIIDHAVDLQPVNVSVTVLVTQDIKAAIQATKSKHLCICIMRDIRVLRDKIMKCMNVPTNLAVGKHTFVIRFVVDKHLLLRGYYISVGYMMPNGKLRSYWVMDNHYPPRLKALWPSFISSVWWEANGHKVNSVKAGTWVTAHITFYANGVGLPPITARICVREDIAHGKDHNAKCVFRALPLVIPGKRFSTTVRFKAEYHHHSYFFFSTYTRGYYITVKFENIYTKSSLLSWEMSNHYPPRLRVKK